MIEFDEAVSSAFEFAARKPGEVLIVVTGDHETGALSFSGINYKIYWPLLLSQRASKDGLVAMTEKFVKDNGENATFERYKTIITEQCGLVFAEEETTDEGRWQPGNLNLTQSEMRELETDFASSKRRILEDRTGKDRVVRTMIRMLNSKSGITWASGGHTALPVRTSTWSNQVGSNQVGSNQAEQQAEQIAKNIQDNTDIAKQLKLTVGKLP
jgi:alkaline phosphatase